MSHRILCYLPAERVSLCTIVFSAQAIPVVDLCYSDRSRVPNGAWVRTRSKRDIPGKDLLSWLVGSIVRLFEAENLAGGNKKFAKYPVALQIIVRTKESGGWCSEKTWNDLQENLTKLDPARTILDVGFSPEEWNSLRDGFAGTVLSSQLIGFSEFGLPANLLSLLQQLNDTHLIHHNNSSVASYPLSEGLKGLVDGIDWWRVSDGWLRMYSSKLPPWVQRCQNRLHSVLIRWNRLSLAIIHH